jgi:hypothetical protein
MPKISFNFYDNESALLFHKYAPNHHQHAEKILQGIKFGKAFEFISREDDNTIAANAYERALKEELFRIWRVED